MSSTVRPTALERVGLAIEQALDEAPTNDVLSIVTAAFVGLTLELVRRQGFDMRKEIKIDGGPQRDITIHAAKETAND